MYLSYFVCLVNGVFFSQEEKEVRGAVHLLLGFPLFLLMSKKSEEGGGGGKNRGLSCSHIAAVWVNWAAGQKPCF